MLRLLGTFFAVIVCGCSSREDTDRGDIDSVAKGDLVLFQDFPQLDRAQALETYAEYVVLSDEYLVIYEVPILKYLNHYDIAQYSIQENHQLLKLVAVVMYKVDGTVKEIRVQPGFEHIYGAHTDVEKAVKN